MAAKIIIPKGDGRAITSAAKQVIALDMAFAWVVEIKRYVKKRTLSQNALMWKWLDQVADIIGEYTGYDVKYIHEFCKKKFLPASGRKIVVICGEEVEVLSTTNLNTLEMSAYMTAIDAWASTELGLVLPHPVDLQKR